jgi:hypothetical protein
MINGNLNTAGYTIGAMAWIDWNQDGDFLDSGRSVILGVQIITMVLPAIAIHTYSNHGTEGSTE